MPTPPTARNALNEFGIDAICRDVADGKSLTAIAISVGTPIGSIVTWLAADPDRSARATAARRATAWYWDEQAERELREAEPTTEGIAKALELASHYRWRASKISPREYGEKIDLHHGGTVSLRPAPIDTSKLTDEQREVFRTVLLLAQARDPGIDGGCPGDDVMFKSAPSGGDTTLQMCTVYLVAIIRVTPTKNGGLAFPRGFRAKAIMPKVRSQPSRGGEIGWREPERHHCRGLASRPTCNVPKNIAKVIWMDTALVRMGPGLDRSPARLTQAKQCAAQL
jgi:hypothetical protein